MDRPCGKTTMREKRDEIRKEGGVRRSATEAWSLHQREASRGLSQQQSFSALIFFFELIKLFFMVTLVN